MKKREKTDNELLSLLMPMRPNDTVELVPSLEICQKCREEQMKKAGLESLFFDSCFITHQVIVTRDGLPKTIITFNRSVFGPACCQMLFGMELNSSNTFINNDLNDLINENNRNRRIDWKKFEKLVKGKSLLKCHIDVSECPYLLEHSIIGYNGAGPGMDRAV